MGRYCPSRMVEHPKSKSNQPSPRGDGSPCTYILFKNPSEPFLVDFLSLLNGTPGLHFGASIGIYESLFRESGVVTHEALASLLKTCYKSEAVRDEVEAMWEAEGSLAFGDHCNCDQGR